MEDFKYNLEGEKNLKQVVKTNFFILVYSVILVFGGITFIYQYAISRYGNGDIPIGILSLGLVIFSIILSKQIIAFVKAIKKVKKDVVRIIVNNDGINVFTPRPVFFKEGFLSFQKIIHKKINHNLSYDTDYDLKLGNICKVYQGEKDNVIFTVVFKFFDDQKRLETIFRT